MSNKLRIVGLVFFILLVILTLIVIFGSNIPELIRKDLEYEQQLKEKLRELSLEEQVHAIQELNEKCIEVRASPNSYMPEMVDKCS